MQIEFRDGLLFTEITIHFNGRSKVINNIVIDTGASNSLISQDEVDDIGIKVTLEDEIITSYGIGGKEHAFVKTVELRSWRFYFEACSVRFHIIQVSQD
jgi:hypothetical protein